MLDATGLPSGTVYPILRRLEQDGLARSKWEAAKLAQQNQRPPRRYYELTRDGEARLNEARARFPILSALPARARERRDRRSALPGGTGGIHDSGPARGKD